MGGGGGGTKTRYTESPEQRALYAAGLPAVETVAGAIAEGQPLWTPPTMPNVAGQFTQGVPSAAAYGIPAPVMPNTGWFQGIAPEVRQGLWEPYREAGMQLMETLGAQGQLGSARGGYTGAAGAALGELASQAARNVGLQAWQMTAPQLMGYRGEMLQRGMMGAQETAQRTMAERQMGYQSALTAQQQQLSALQAPYQILPGMMGGMAPTLPTGVTTPTTSTMGTIGSGLMGGGMGALGAMALGANPLWGIPIGLGAMMMGGK